MVAFCSAFGHTDTIDCVDQCEDEGQMTLGATSREERAQAASNAYAARSYPDCVLANILNHLMRAYNNAKVQQF